MMMNQRELFEKWRTELCVNEMAGKASMQREGDGYYSTHTQIAWQAWQAAISAQWQPIETAPKDGQMCAVYDPYHDVLKVWPAQYDEENKSFTAGTHGSAGWFGWMVRIQRSDALGATATGASKMTDNAELVHITHAGISFDALVELMPEDQDVTLFYAGVDMAELLPFFDSRVRYNIERMAVTAAMKKRADKTADDKYGDSL